MHQREAILPTEVNKLDLSDAAVKVDTCKGRGNSNDMRDTVRRNHKPYNVVAAGANASN